MIIKVFSIRDTKSEAFQRPFFDVSTGSAIRAFTQLVNSGDTEQLVALCPEDFALFEIGEFDDSTGALIPLQQPHRLANAFEVKRTA